MYDINEIINTIIQGDCVDVLKEIPDESIDMVITSPPYWGLRDYGVEGQLGNETTYQEYIANLINIFNITKRILKNDGSIWINLGDSYSGSNQGAGTKNPTPKQASNKGTNYMTTENHKSILTKCGIKEKSLVGIPDRFKIAMIDNGWICRNDIIWKKNNAMPASVTDRFTVDYERLFFFTKNKKYYFEQQKEACSDTYNGKRGSNKTRTKLQSSMQCTDDIVKIYPDRNKRCVWTINTESCKEAHFAVYPTELIVTPIKASCPEFICCDCNKPRKLIMEKVGEFQRRWGSNAEGSPYIVQGNMQNIYQNLGYEDCCNNQFKSGIVLDPFMGSGTTGLVAKQLNRNYIGIELKPEYIEIAKKRINS